VGEDGVREEGEEKRGGQENPLQVCPCRGIKGLSFSSLLLSDPLNYAVMLPECYSVLSGCFGCFEDVMQYVGK
jgi:hypothetical protein